MISLEYVVAQVCKFPHAILGFLLKSQLSSVKSLLYYLCWDLFVPFCLRYLLSYRFSEGFLDETIQ